MDYVDEELYKMICIVCGCQLNDDGSCNYCKIQKRIDDRDRRRKYAGR